MIVCVYLCVCVRMCVCRTKSSNLLEQLCFPYSKFIQFLLDHVEGVVEASAGGGIEYGKHEGKVSQILAHLCTNSLHISFPDLIICLIGILDILCII